VAVGALLPAVASASWGFRVRSSGRRTVAASLDDDALVNRRELVTRALSCPDTDLPLPGWCPRRNPAVGFAIASATQGVLSYHSA
jgi:hypothetical protein